MRRWCGWITAACCMSSALAITYLHGYERALGHAEWTYRPALVEVYSGEVVFRAGPCVLAGLANLLSVWRGSRFGLVSVCSLMVAGVTVAGTLFTIQQYIITPPGQFMPTTTWDGVIMIGWVDAISLLLVSAISTSASRLPTQSGLAERS